MSKTEAPIHQHSEGHFSSPEIIRDLVIGMSDGLTVPFALAAGLSTALGNNNVVVTAGLAEIAAGAIAMGLGGYLAARSEFDHYHSERRREQREVHEVPHVEQAELREIFRAYELSESESEPLVQALSKKPEAWVDFMMRFELGLEKPDPARARQSAVTIAASYILGGLIPLMPYIFTDNTQRALGLSVAVTLLALLVFGYVKGRYTSGQAVGSALKTAFIGALAAGAAYFVAKLVT